MNKHSKQRWGFESENWTQLATRVAILGFAICLGLAYSDLRLDTRTASDDLRFARDFTLGNLRLAQMLKL